MNSSTDSAFSGSFGDAIKVGYIRRAHGVQGLVVLKATTDDPDRFAVGAVLDTDSDDLPVATVRSVQSHKYGLLVSFEGVEDRDVADRLRGTSLFVPRDARRELPADEFWPDDLVGLKVVDLAGVALGEVKRVITGPAQDRLEVSGPDGAFEVPFVAALIPEVDLTAGRLTVDLPEGLI